MHVQGPSTSSGQAAQLCRNCNSIYTVTTVEPHLSGPQSYIRAPQLTGQPECEVHIDIMHAH